MIGVFAVISLAFAAALVSIPAHGQSHANNDDSGTYTYDELYEQAVGAYLENNYEQCVWKMRAAMSAEKAYRSKLAECRRECHQASHRSSLIVSNDKAEDLKFYERAILNTLCLMKCKQERVNTRPDFAAPKKIDDDFEARNTYDYLQLCYYKVNDPQSAASCAYTYLLYNPDHQVMKDNYKFYISQPGVSADHVQNLESQDYQELYLKGNEAYNKLQYTDVVTYFEEALKEYYAAEEECRLLCEGKFAQSPLLDLTMTVANHFTFSLRCKHRCPVKLAYIYGEHYKDYLPSHYHYLQFAYYKLGNLEKACEAVATYIIFHPDDQTMLHNKEFYSLQNEAAVNYFKPSAEAVVYLERSKEEERLLKFIEDNFLSMASTAQNTKTLIPPGDKNPGKAEATLTVQMIPPDDPDNIGIKVLMDEKKLNGSLRFAADGFVTNQECEELIYLASNAAVNGDGYNGRPTPHTEFETFEGLSVGRAAVLVKLGLLSVDKVQLLIDVSERSRQYIKEYFNLKRELYFSYTHLVCRTAHADSPVDRKDFSHPVHADNCVLMNGGECIKDEPAFTWRDYSAIVYLNGDFDGGEFIFAKDKDTVQAIVKPKCGRMVGFSAGKENLHGVQAVKKGRRCALAMWYTLDVNHREKDRFLAEQVLRQLTEKVESNDILQESVPVGPPIGEQQIILDVK